MDTTTEPVVEGVAGQQTLRSKRRSRSVEAKWRIVQETLRPGASVIRESLGAGAPEAAAIVPTCTCGDTASIGYRTVPGGPVFQAGSPAVSTPVWLKVVRAANTFAAYASSDGSGWTQLGTTQTITSGKTVYVGFGVSSYSPATVATATFDNVSISLGGSVPNPVINGVSAD